MTVFAEVIFFLFLCNRSIINCFRWTIADAGHAVGALIAPDRFAVFHGNIVEGT